MSNPPDPGTPDHVDETPTEEIVDSEVVDAPSEQQLELPENPAEAVPMLISELMAAPARCRGSNEQLAEDRRGVRQLS